MTLPEDTRTEVTRLDQTGSQITSVIDESDHIGVASARSDARRGNNSGNSRNAGGNAANEGDEATALVSARTIANVVQGIEQGNRALLWEIVAKLRDADLADVIEQLSPRLRVRLVSDLGSAFNFRALGEVEDRVREQLVTRHARYAKAA